MTREERDKAKNVINELELYAEDLQYHSADEMKEALDMAIRAFEQQPCEDAISRQAAIDVTWEEPSYTDALNVLTEVREKVRALPSVNPQEPKTGHWINLKDTYGDIVESVCSNCDYNGNYKWNYCPNCGIKIVKPQESEE